jgi:K(+)-stimulated pyrophosphate-energized sodium pump
MDQFLVFSTISVSLVSLAYAGVLTYLLVQSPTGCEKMAEVAAAIQQGASAYLNRQNRTIGVFAILVAVILWVGVSATMALSFLFGSSLSALAGWIGMTVATRANVRTAEAAKDSLHKALDVSFRGGAIVGMCVVGFSLLGVSVTYWFTGNPESTIGFGFGASLVSLFARVGGGIFTKAADVGADLVGKIEKDIPEDDARNPATIADNVGDNVGDCAGMGADLFETYAVTLIAAMVLAHNSPEIQKQYGQAAVNLPFALGAVAALASIIGAFFVRLKDVDDTKIMATMYRGMIVAGGISAIGFYFVIDHMLHDIRVFYAAMVGLAITVLINLITEYYTATEFAPVQHVARSSLTGAGTNIISGLAVGFRSTAWPVFTIVGGIGLTYFFAGLYGIAIAAVAMLGTTGLVIALDSYGPITDNAGGIAEMAGLPKSTRVITDALDAVGNTTKAVTKGYAIGSAALAALVLFQAYYDAVSSGRHHGITFLLTDHKLLMGLFLGGLMPFLFSAFTMDAVGKAAHAVVEEVRRQFRENPGIMTHTTKPDYRQAVDIVTRAALKEMIFPASMAVIFPLLTGFILGPSALAGMLGGIIISGFNLALYMSNAGAAWDNSKKLIESGAHGGKGSDAHKAAVIGDTVGDPFKDTSGPALNALIKVVNMVALIIAPFI